MLSGSQQTITEKVPKLTKFCQYRESGPLPLDRAVSRRSFLKFGGAAALTLSPVTALANASRSATSDKAVRGERALRFDNLHTGEKLKAVYWRNGKYLRDGLEDINRILRDFRTDQIKPIDRNLLDLLHALNKTLETDKPYEVISGYRSPKTNEMLRAKSSRVARNSYHMRGMAIDLRVPGRELIQVRRAALKLQNGGVGYYPSSNFVHVDVGPVRAW